MWITESVPGSGSGHLIDYLPTSEQVCIVFTSRNRNAAVKLAQQNLVEISEMDEDVATQMLQKYLIDSSLVTSEPETKALLKELIYLPLAIAQAAAYTNENGISVAEYLSLLTDQEEEVIDLLSEEFVDEGRYRNIKNPVATTWLISFEQIRNHDPLAEEYLSFMCCIDSKDIPESLLPPGPSRKKEIEAIGTLSAYSFISKRTAGVALTLHRLVHLATRNWLRKENLLASSTEKVILRLKEVFPGSSDKNRSLWRTYLPHARYVLESNLVDKDWKKRIRLLNKYGMCLYEDGRWNEAEAAFSEVLEYRKRNLGADHRHTLSSMSNISSIYGNQRRWDAAEELQLQVLETSKTKLGTDHPNTLACMSNLASTYKEQGRWDAAEELELQVLETSKTKLGVDHPDTLIIMNNLAYTWKGCGRNVDALKLMEECVIARTRVLGANHPHTVYSREPLLELQADELEICAETDR